jgi:hypothetical protein
MGALTSSTMLSVEQQWTGYLSVGSRHQWFTAQFAMLKRHRLQRRVWPVGSIAQTTADVKCPGLSLIRQHSGTPLASNGKLL